MQNHLLSWIVFTPLAGALACLILPQSATRYIKWVAAAVSLLTGLLSLDALLQFDKSITGFQLIEKSMWISQFNIHYFLGVDGISLPMITLTALVSFLACLASFGIQKREKEYYSLFLLLETGMMGTFLALDLMLFYVFWEVVLIPMYFLIGIWGGSRKEYAALKFFLYTLAGSLFMLIGILALYFKSAPHTFDLTQISTAAFTLKFQKALFLSFFFAFAIKVPIWPFHTWLPDAHVEAPTPISVILAGVLLKMGTYGFLRFSYPLAPEAAVKFAPYLAVLAVIGIVYGGFVALAQKDFKKMVAYSSVSHMGFVVLGLAALNSAGFSGAMLQMFNHGIITSGLFLLVGVLYDRAHTRDMTAFGGLAAQLPLYSGILIFFSMASLGLPGLAGFISEFLILSGGFQYSRLAAGLSSLGIFLAAAYLLFMVRRVLYGPANPKWQSLNEINRLELITLVPLMILIVVLGVAPQLILNYINPTLNALLVQLGGIFA